tara:strand:+ start:5817 stop:6158 length:342 start_codon:yes stop_codon:yes gene_type:complete
MKLIYIVMALGAVFFLIKIIKVFYDARVPSGRQFSDEELKNVPFDEWEALSITNMKKTGTTALQIYLQQYEDLKERIDANDPRTMSNLDDQGIERSLASLGHVKAELDRRNAA